MIEKKKLQTYIELAMASGADFAEIFLEHTNNKLIRVMNGEVTSIDQGNIHGAGIRLIQGVDEVYGYLNELSEDNITTLIKNLSASFNDEKKTVVPLGDPKPFKNNIEKPFNQQEVKAVTDKLIGYSNLMKAHDDRIVQAISQMIQIEQKVWIANSKGIYQDDVRNYIRVMLSAVAKKDQLMQSASEGPGRFMGYEIFDMIDFEKLAKETAISAIKLLSAKDMMPQVMPVVLHNGFGGVIFHEACGHPLEATSVAKGLSPFTHKLGEKIGSDIVSAYDDGTIDGAWGKLNFDDEGMPTQKNLLIENGVLKGFLIDYRNGIKMGMNPTGSSRRQSYKFSPTSRMNSTYIAPGQDDFEQIIKDTKYGLFAKKLGGGTVVPATGEFNFVVQEGYMIEDGKLTDAVRGAMLIGQGKDVLFKIDRIANNLELGQGMCGSISGSIPVDVGQPTLRVSSMQVGGPGGTK